MKPAEEYAVQRVTEEGLYVCGSPLFEPDSNYSGIVVRESIQCANPMEVVYYASKTIGLPIVCYHCGKGNDMLDDEETRELKRQYCTVRPICVTCKAAGLSIITRAAKNVGKRQKKK